MSQTDAILDYLRKGGSLTPKDALEQFGCGRLASRIFEIRKRGIAVESRLIEVKTDVHVAEYKLV